MPSRSSCDRQLFLLEDPVRPALEGCSGAGRTLIVSTVRASPRQVRQNNLTHGHESAVHVLDGASLWAVGTPPFGRLPLESVRELIHDPTCLSPRRTLGWPILEMTTAG